MAEKYPQAVLATVTRSGWRDDWELKITDSAGTVLWMWVIPPFSDFFNKSERHLAALDHVGPRLNSVGVRYKGSAAWSGNASAGWRAELFPEP